ncbi:MAG: aminoacyl-tRNA hydrolase [Chlamydiales bacterium]|nr:aminoacyl-tRNA hydrolase [Chlamydiales bacterium]
MAPKCLIVGLGNPGKAYEETRHNVGFQVLRAYAEKKGLVFRSTTGFIGELAQGRLYDKKTVLLLPLTYMNSSGEAVSICCHYFEVAKENVLVVCDDIALPFGALRLKPKGSSGGHNGLKSIEQHLSTQEFPRLRVGIGEKGGGTLSEHVLGRFTPEERRDLPQIVERAADAVDMWLSSGIESSMRVFNKDKIEEIGE